MALHRMLKARDGRKQAHMDVLVAVLCRAISPLPCTRTSRLPTGRQLQAQPQTPSATNPQLSSKSVEGNRENDDRMNRWIRPSTKTRT